jgi:hypothetical protein
MNKTVSWIVGGILAIGVFFLISKRKANAAAIVSADVITQGQTLAPIPGQSAPSLSLCRAAVPVAGAAVGLYYGVPPAVTLPAGAAASGPICQMGSKIATNAISGVKDSVKVAAKVGAIAAVSTNGIAKDTLKLAGKVTDPVAFAKGTASLSVKTVTTPIKTTVAVGAAVGSGIKKISDPRKWF